MRVKHLTIQHKLSYQVGSLSHLYSDFQASCNGKPKSVERQGPSYTNVFSLCSHCCLYSHDGG